MDPISVTSLVASSIGLADVVTRLGCGLRHLQQEFSGALDHVDNITQQTGTIDFAIREICSLLRRSPDTFPSSFESRLKESTAAIDEVVGQIQDHAQSVQAEAEKSPRKGKLLHLQHASKVLQWENNLSVLIQALSLLLQVAQLCVPSGPFFFCMLTMRRRSNSERTSALERDSSKKLFEKASSMSARIGNSSRTPSPRRPCLTNIKSFSFDPSLLETKVYRRACESLWKREVTMHGEEIGDNTSASSSSMSSNDAIASQSEGSIPGRSVAAGERPSSNASLPEVGPDIYQAAGIKLPAARMATRLGERELQRTSTGPPQLVSEPSTCGTTQVSTVDTNATESTLATVMSSSSQFEVVGEPSSKNHVSSGKSIVLVIVETVGCDHVELPVRGPDYYNVIRDTIFKVRDGILADRGISPTTYGRAMASCMIETSGQAIDRFPFTVAFLDAALEMMDEGFYTAIEILARFPTPLSSINDRITSQIPTTRHEEPDATTSDGTLGITREWRASRTSSVAPHFILDANAILPFSDQVLTRKGGFSDVYKVKVHLSYLESKDAQQEWFAVKRLTGCNDKPFWREVDALNRCASKREESHIVKLLSTFEHRQRGSNQYYLLFPWAECNLREFWETDTLEFRSRQPSQRSNIQHVLWVAQQCAGLAAGLLKIHSALNKSLGNTPHSPALGRHGDIKPENILWFKDDMSSTNGILRICDMGLCRSHKSAMKSRVNNAAKLPCTPTYRAPEYELAPMGGRVSRSYDIWSLGCVYLEFITWYLEGWNGVEEFRQERHAHVKDDAFFITDPDGKFSLNPSVTQQLEELKVKASSFSPPIDEGLISFLTFVATCLEVDEDKRPLAKTLAEQFMGLYTKLDKAMASKRNIVLC
ncbi:hypothetical protein DL765_009955 [Monosporascus sp. GIB2]|nr:hypothetical protein DL765_009955 [Monosporascus sp. GIB2]